MSKTPDTILSRWLREATPDEREQLALAGGTTVNYLYQLAGCSRGKRGPSSLMAALIEAKADELHSTSGGRLPKLPVIDLATMCQIAQDGDEG